MIAFNKYYNHFNVVSTFLIIVSLILLIFTSVDLSSIKVPPLKSIPKLSPLKINKTNETTIRNVETTLKWL